MSIEMFLAACIIIPTCVICWRWWSNPNWKKDPSQSD